jgi:imidazolonepropionase-like amidohydrolase
MPTRLAALALLLASCALSPRGDAGTPSVDRFVLHGATVVLDGQHAILADLTIAAGQIVDVGTADPTLPQVDVTGTFLAPAFIDSHVHLAYRPEPMVLARGGIAAAIDLAAPIYFLAGAHPPLQVRSSGPMITAVGGYPTRSWGQGGYGVEVASPLEAAAAVDRLADAGVALIKLPFDEFGPQLDADTARAAVKEAHQFGLRVAAHALTDSMAATAAAVGADLLAHTPEDGLSPTTIDAWRGKTVLSTLAAFGGGPFAVRNLQALRAAGLTVLYGTDFGNGSTAGIDASELSLLLQAGLDGAAILEAGTSAPATFWGLTSLGRLEAGRAASLLVLDADPRKDPMVLTHPRAIYLDGVLLTGP